MNGGTQEIRRKVGTERIAGKGISSYVQSETAFRLIEASSALVPDKWHSRKPIKLPLLISVAMLCGEDGTLRAGQIGRDTMAKLTTSKKKAEPKSDFGLPEQRKYPMPDANHARNAKARASQMEHQGKLSPGDKKKIDAKADKILGEEKP